MHLAKSFLLGSGAIVIAGAPLLWATPSHAAPESRPLLASPFTDEMVLQRDIADPVWGWSAPGTTVTVAIAGRSVKTIAGADGAWRVSLPPLKAGGPYTLTVTAGEQTQTLKDVLVGDVWICSGQSNMEFGVGNLANASAEIAAANYPQIRLFLAGHQVSTSPQAQLTSGQWMTCTPANIANGGWNGFSAVGYFFGRDIYQSQHIPIGLIGTYWGGTPAEAWTSETALNAHLPEFRSAIESAKRFARDPQSGPKQLESWYRQHDPGSAAGQEWSATALDDSGWKTMRLPGAWESAGIPELANFDGTVWFRKEIDLTAEQAGKDAVLRFTVDDDDTAWVNGQQVGATIGYNVGRAYPIPSGLLKEGRNVIAIRVLDTGGAGGVTSVPILELGGAPLDLSGDWRYAVGVALTPSLQAPRVAPYDQNSPTVLFNGMINPFIPYGIKGAIWYQGESNGGRGYQYRTLLPTMIGDWRSRWGVGNFPFYIVQLANYQAPPKEPGDDGWAEVREAQAMTAERTPNAGLAVTIDIGEAGDIHPKNKQEVGRRLALVALAKTYKQKVEFSGPVYKSQSIENGAIRLRFQHLGGGLVAKGGPLKQFAIAGEDRKFVWADARIDGDTVIVSSPLVPRPVAVRYAWAINPEGANLYNQADLPAVPFRTDDWPLSSVNAK